MIANTLTFARLVLAAAFAACVGLLLRDDGLSSGGAGVLIVLAIAEELTDILDGMAARRLGTVSMFGGIFDPLIDSLSRLTIYFAMALVGWITLAVPFVMAGRDVVVAYTRIAKAISGGKTSARFTGKLKAVVQGGGIVVVVLLAWLADHSGERATIPFLSAMGPDVVRTLRLITAGILIAVTTWSLCDYVQDAWPAIRQFRKM